MSSDMCAGSRWRSRTRYAALLVLIPALALSDGYNAWALAGWQIPFALLGVALYQEGSAPEHRAPVGRAA